MDTYRVVRKYFDNDIPDELIDEMLTLEEAQDHCNSPETSSRTCLSKEGQERTDTHGQWFDGYEVE